MVPLAAQPAVLQPLADVSDEVITTRFALAGINAFEP
jgi:hypothetical protein